MWRDSIAEGAPGMCIFDTIVPRVLAFAKAMHDRGDQPLAQALDAALAALRGTGVPSVTSDRAVRLP